MALKSDIALGVKDEASGPLNGIRAAFEKFRVSVETNSKGINKLDGAFRGLGAQAASLPGPFGRVADALTEFAPGGLVGGAVLAGIGAIAFAFNNHKKQQEEAIKLTDQLRQSSTEQYLAFVKLEQGVEAYNIELAKTNVIQAENLILDYTKQIVELEKRTRAEAQRLSLMSLAAGTGFAGEPGGAIDRGKQQISIEDALAEVRRRYGNEALILLNKLNETAKAFAAGRLQQEDNAAAAADKAASDRQKRLQNEFSEFQQLFDLQADGYVLNEERQNRLNQLSNQYADILNDANAPLDQIKYATQAVDIVTRHLTTEYEKQSKIKEDQNKAEKEKYKLAGQAAAEAAQNAIKELELADQVLMQNFTAARGVQNLFFDDFKKRLTIARNELTIAIAEGLPGPIIAAQKKVKELEDTLLNKITSSMAFTAADIGLTSLVSGLDAAFEALVNGTNAAAAFGKAMRQSISQSLMALGREQIVKGLSNLAAAFAAIAIGGPFGGKTAAEYTKAASLNFAAAAAAGVGARAVSGPGGAGGGRGAGQGFNDSRLGSNQFTTQPVTIIVQGGSLLDMSNPETQRSFVSAMETVTNRRVRMVGA